MLYLCMCPGATKAQSQHRSKPIISVWTFERWDLSRCKSMWWMAFVGMAWGKRNEKGHQLERNLLESCPKKRDWRNHHHHQTPPEGIQTPSSQGKPLEKTLTISLYTPLMFLDMDTPLPISSDMSNRSKLASSRADQAVKEHSDQNCSKPMRKGLTTFKRRAPKTPRPARNKRNPESPETGFFKPFYLQDL